MRSQLNLRKKSQKWMKHIGSKFKCTLLHLRGVHQSTISFTHGIIILTIFVNIYMEAVYVILFFVTSLILH